MGEHERSFGGGGLRSLSGAALLLVLFCATAAIPLSPGQGRARLASPAFQAELAGIGALRIAAVLSAMALGGGFGAYGLRRIAPADLPKALAAGAGAFAVAAGAALAASAAGFSNPLMAGPGGKAGAAVLALGAASSAATGYAEELFFRAYLLDRLALAGLSPAWAAAASSLLFGGFHGAQGAVGIAAAALVGLWLTWRWNVGRNIHEIALGHGLYDAAVLALALYAA